ncbi:polysaccharide deacetylase [Pseudomaricurvus sp. HS19]|uniref:polysaccharide deacetylase n=1 Tax=Pseudomaricurvus sp. HS19 TaxID=2692626 RepID=UPI00136E4C66|nr:polysaccharide deacetylase [Pseudomaricurvus sp. HS19]MYM62873.1 polysaccharide deacetylase [Pseudomaricurvus sp. HS19]
MIYVLSAGDSDYAGDLVTAALCRSVPSNLVKRVCASQLHTSVERGDSEHIWVLINPLACWGGSLQALLRDSANKVLLFGSVPESLWQYLGLSKSGEVGELAQLAKAPPAPTYGEGCSEARIEYRRPISDQISPLQTRYFSRYDFMEEWNNMGYGAITVDDTPWALADCLQAPASTIVAEVMAGEHALAAYAAKWDFNGSLFWFARAVGPIDSQEWRLVEVYLAHYRSDELACAPVVSEIPAGYDCAVTMRLDCDEDVESARQLWQAYCAENVPLSLALHAAVLPDSKHHQLPKDVLASGGSILSHTLTHAPNWGGSYLAALHEGCESMAAIESAIGHKVRYAVSPFHHTPVYARKALADAGYEGCVGGIICNDPDYMTARSGNAVGQGIGFIGFPQQCMLHGDCMQQAEDPLTVFKQAFATAKAGQHFFGYLDHPFSERYAYGWQSEEQRINAHKTFLDFIRQTSGNVLFANLDDAFDFLGAKSAVRATVSGDGLELWTQLLPPNGWQLEYEYRGARMKVVES